MLQCSSNSLAFMTEAVKFTTTSSKIRHSRDEPSQIRWTPKEHSPSRKLVGCCFFCCGCFGMLHFIVFEMLPLCWFCSSWPGRPPFDSHGCKNTHNLHHLGYVASSCSAAGVSLCCHSSSTLEPSVLLPQAQRQSAQFQRPQTRLRIASRTPKSP